MATPKKPTPPAPKSEAVRIGGAAIQLLRDHAKANGLNLRGTVEAIIMQLGPPAVPAVAVRTKAAKAARLATKGGAQ